ncbi:MAG: hypothetical protein V1685_06245 [Parcubacteria group bacterium]
MPVPLERGKHPWIVWPLVAVAVVAYCALCADNANRRSADEEILLSLTTEVLPGVYDDGQSTAYIKVDNPVRQQEGAAVIDIMAKKSAWERTYPARQVITMSVVTGDSGPDTIVVGMLIHYKQC